MPDITKEQAATEQVKREIRWIALYISQKRHISDSGYNRAMQRLVTAMRSCPHVGHGTVNWEAFVTIKASDVW